VPDHQNADTFRGADDFPGYHPAQRDRRSYASHDLRGLFSTYRLLKKQTTQLKNRIHSLLKERLYGFTQEEIFGKKSRARIRDISEDPVLKFQLNFLLDRLEQDEADVDALKEQILLTQSLNHVMDSSLKLRKWYERLSEYKKAGLVRTGLRPPLRKQDLGFC
jgi:transposase